MCAVLPEQRCGQAVLCAVVQRVADHAGLRAVCALSPELPAAAPGAQHTPRQSAQLHSAAPQRPTA